MDEEVKSKPPQKDVYKRITLALKYTQTESEKIEKHIFHTYDNQKKGRVYM